MSNKFFLAGTDTDVGKTVISAALLKAANRQELTTLGLKPVAAGCEKTEEGFRNSDALTLMSASTVEASYEMVNPVALEPPIAPHIAAEQVGKRLQASRLVGYVRGSLMTHRADFTLVEGAGGWRVPISPRETMADLAKALDLPVILVVGMRLGCLNHAMLTAEAIQRDGLKLAGWVGNRIDPDMSFPEENLEALHRWVPAPFLGVVPWLRGDSENDKAELAADHLDISPLLQQG